MSNDMMANSLVQTWVPVTDSQGQTRLEAHWVAPRRRPRTSRRPPDADTRSTPSGALRAGSTHVRRKFGRRGMNRTMVRLR